MTLVLRPRGTLALRLMIPGIVGTRSGFGHIVAAAARLAGLRGILRTA